MPLKIFTICDPEAGEQAYNEWMKANPGIRIQTRHVCAHLMPAQERMGQILPPTAVDTIYVFYESANDNEYRKNLDLIAESAQLEMCEDIAKSLKLDPVYKALTNKTQRRLYLLHTKMLPSGDADLVAELMTPQLSKLIEGSL